MIQILIALALWLAVLLSSSLITLLLSRFTKSKKHSIEAFANQLLFLFFSLLLIYWLSGGSFTRYGFKWDMHYTLISLLAFPLSLALLYLSQRFSEGYKPPFIPENTAILIFLLLFLAPLSEETFFRGLIGGYLINTSNFLYALFLSPILFSIVHILPFHSAPRKYTIMLLLNAFILGLIAMELFYLSHSLLPAITTHALFNLSGLIFYHLSNRKR
ncbi:hypothetical protein B6U71_03620 [Euryarchaeota archaeon ex4484_178]|nr:MAG: hypothetical protein B6U71_03620 [Euryarchaeota archaeon ex4484_178]